MVEVTIEITQFCEEECSVCSSSATPEGKHLSFRRIKEFLRHQSDIKRINVSGGEPLAHPDIYKILKFCYGITDNTWVYTNMIKNIIFNANVLNEVGVETNLLIVPGNIVCVPEHVDKIHLLKFVPTGRYPEYVEDIPITASHNFFEDCGHDCTKCDNVLLQADGKIVSAPCKKEYK